MYPRTSFLVNNHFFVAAAFISTDFKTMTEIIERERETDSRMRTEKNDANVNNESAAE